MLAVQMTVQPLERINLGKYRGLHAHTILPPYQGRK